MFGKMYNQFLLPIDQYNLTKKKFNLDTRSNDFELSGLIPFESGKSIIHYLAKKFKLKRSDEVFISTTTNSSFVSTCVTATLFNYCKLSRILTSNTKLIYVIHEFGFPNKQIKELIKLSNDRNIPIVEDVAHSFNSKMNNQLLGRIAPYGFCSLPKFIPMNKGALFFNNNDNKVFELNEENKQILDEFSLWKKYLKHLKGKSQSNYKIYQSEISCHDPIFEYNDNINPFIYGFKHEGYKKINQLLEKKGIQVSKTYVKNHVLLPTNPLIDETEIYKNIKILNQFL